MGVWDVRGHVGTKDEREEIAAAGDSFRTAAGVDSSFTVDQQPISHGEQRCTAFVERLAARQAGLKRNSV
jgi:hypothetical protein